MLVLVATARSDASPASDTVPQATEWQRIGNQINAASVFARADFVNVHSQILLRNWLKTHCCYGSEYGCQKNGTYWASKSNFAF